MDVQYLRIMMQTVDSKAPIRFESFSNGKQILNFIKALLHKTDRQSCQA